MRKFLKIILRTVCIALVASTMMVVSGCEDTPPSSYIVQPVVEAYLIVDKPITGVHLMRSQSVTDTFHVQAGVIPDANVTIMRNGTPLQLQFRTVNGVGEYWYPDTTEVVLPNAVYDLSIVLADNSTITARTNTPGRVTWAKTPPDTLQYPVDTLNLVSPDSSGFTWNAVPGLQEYLLSAQCLDTLEYGMYLNPPTAEKNRRMVRFFDDADPHYDEIVRWGFSPSAHIPIVWAAYKWYGLQQVNVFAADANMVNWFKMTHWAQNPSYDNLLGSIKGGLGVFGSASVVSAKLFVKKNQP